MTDISGLSTIDTLTKTHTSEVASVSTFKELREAAGLTAFSLASRAEVSLSTVNRMEYGSGLVTKRIANQVLNVIGEKVGRRISLEEVEGLKVK